MQDWRTESKYHLEEINYHFKCAKESVEEAKRHLEHMKRHFKELPMYDWEYEDPFAPCLKDEILDEQYDKWITSLDCKCDFEEDRECDCLTFEEWFEEIQNKDWEESI